MEILAVMLATVYWQVFNCYAILYSTFAFVIKKEIMYVFTVCFTGLQLGSNNKKPEPASICLLFGEMFICQSKHMR